MHFLGALGDRLPLSSVFLQLREISGNQRDSACLRKNNDLGEHPVRLRGVLANSIL